MLFFFFYQQKFDEIIKYILEIAYWKIMFSLKSATLTPNSFHYVFYFVTKKTLKVICWLLYSSLLNYFPSWAVTALHLHSIIIWEFLC